MTVTVLLFAGAADLVGKRQVEIELNEGVTLRELSALLGEEHPSLMPLLKISRWAVDRQFVNDQALVALGQEIALIPPVSGG